MLRTYEAVLRLSDAQRLDSLADWPEYTMNTVVLNVCRQPNVSYDSFPLTCQISGPDQQDLHMIDLPGKSSRSPVVNKANQKVLAKSLPATQLSESFYVSRVRVLADHLDLIEHYAQKKENVIVHCMAASGCTSVLIDLS